MTESKCPKCGDSGKLPFYRSDGTVSFHAIVYCDCHQDEPRFYETTPSDIDFPVSDYCWRALARENGWSQAVTASREVVREVVIERQPANMLPIKSELVYLRNKIAELHSSKKKIKSKYD